MQASQRTILRFRGKRLQLKTKAETGRELLWVYIHDEVSLSAEARGGIWSARSEEVTILSVGARRSKLGFLLLFVGRIDQLFARLGIVSCIVLKQMTVLLSIVGVQVSTVKSTSTRVSRVDRGKRRVLDEPDVFRHCE